MASLIVNTYQAKTQLSRLIEQAQKGVDVTIARRGKPLVRLTPVDAASQRTLGFFGGVLSEQTLVELTQPLDDEMLAHWENGA
ncbi:MAG: type II toxin-antitoxin system prevent-host-death family antitoxin [Micrococcales bacterium]|nr:type II toxin-antitoxin system prevent-host-death family antitoxin [Micrococcales bacterium]